MGADGTDNRNYGDDVMWISSEEVMKLRKAIAIGLDNLRTEQVMTRKTLDVGLAAVAGHLASILFAMSRPGPVGIRQTREELGMPFFVLTLPPVKPEDKVVTRELSVSLAGGERISLSPAVDAAESDELGPINYGDSIVGTLIDVDRIGNRSGEETFDLVLADTTPPATPGDVGFRVTREE